MKCFLVHNDGLAVVAGGLCGFLPGTPATAELKNCCPNFYYSIGRHVNFDGNQTKLLNDLLFKPI